MFMRRKFCLKFLSGKFKEWEIANKKQLLQVFVSSTVR